ncbi:hypothetical protein AMECASPLE_031904, partial [Ameca splendens]
CLSFQSTSISSVHGAQDISSNIWGRRPSCPPGKQAKPETQGTCLVATPPLSLQPKRGWATPKSHIENIPLLAFISQAKASNLCDPILHIIIHDAGQSQPCSVSKRGWSMALKQGVVLKLVRHSLESHRPALAATVRFVFFVFFFY